MSNEEVVDDMGYVLFALGLLSLVGYDVLREWSTQI